MAYTRASTTTSASSAVKKASKADSIGRSVTESLDQYTGTGPVPVLGPMRDRYGSMTHKGYWYCITLNE